MWFTLWRQSLELISAARCCACGDACERNSADAFCERCLNELVLPEGGVQGDQPLLWCALAPYRGRLRALLLRQRPTPAICWPCRTTRNTPWLPFGLPAAKKPRLT